MDNKQPIINYRSIKKNALKYPVHIGDIYGVYKVIEEVKIPTKKCYVTKWKCINMNTGQEYIAPGGYLYKLKERVDKKFQERGLYGLRNWLYRTTLTNAEGRHHTFNLTFEEFDSIIKQPCYYCGDPPKMVDMKTLKARGDTHQPPIAYNGIDRINPDLGYTVENCVPCCSICNYMKHVQQKEAFLTLVAKIYNHLHLINKGSTTIESTSLEGK